MDRNKFLKKLKYNLRYLKKKDKVNALEKYQNLANYNLDPVKEANKIYEELGLKTRITNNIKFFDATSIILNSFKNKDKLGDIIFFFIKMLLLIIFIKIPFIYVRDMISTLLGDIFINETNYMIWSISIELIYAFVSIIVLIKQFKKKAFEINKVV